MKIRFEIDASCSEPEVVIRAAGMTEEINQIIRQLGEESPSLIPGIQDDRIELLNPDDLIRVYAQNGKIFAVTAKGEYALRQRLYEWEERLDKRRFVRISNSEIINLNQVLHFDLNLVGTICVRLSNGTTTYVSRRYVSKIKQLLGL